MGLIGGLIMQGCVEIANSTAKLGDSFECCASTQDLAQSGARSRTGEREPRDKSDPNSV